MKILITTGLGKTDIGGPFQYAYNLEREFQNLGHEVKVVSYGSVEKLLPIGLRHLYFFFRILFKCLWTDRLLILDTFSVGIPSVAAARICGKKSIVRVGGDYLWSAYVNRTEEPLTLPAFYQGMLKLNLKEKIIFFFTRKLIRNTDFLAFNTEWQRGIWKAFYGIEEGKSGVVRNFISEKRDDNAPPAKKFVWAGRLIPEKNPKMLKKFGIDIITGESHENVLGKIKNSYAVVSLALTDICPNFIIEAASFNKPFIMTRETGLNEIFPKGGIFVDPLDETAIQNAMQALLDDNTYNKYVLELRGNNIKHSWDELAKEFLDIWNKI